MMAVVMAMPERKVKTNYRRTRPHVNGCRINDGRSINHWSCGYNGRLLDVYGLLKDHLLNRSGLINYSCGLLHHNGSWSHVNRVRFQCPGDNDAGADPCEHTSRYGPSISMRVSSRGCRCEHCQGCYCD